MHPPSSSFPWLPLGGLLLLLTVSACGGSKPVSLPEPPPEDLRTAMDRQMDTQAQELTEILSYATVERIDQGIRVTFHAAVLFGFDSSDLSEAAFESLDLFAESMERYRNTHVHVVGHTDNVGAEEYNQSLSMRRAESVVDRLSRQGVPSERVDMSGKGESAPIDSNETEAGRQRNRRVELVITAAETL